MEKIGEMLENYKELLIKDDCLTVYGSFVFCCLAFGCFLSFMDCVIK